MFSGSSAESSLNCPWPWQRLTSACSNSRYWRVNTPSSDLMRVPSFSDSNLFYINEDNNLLRAIQESFDSQQSSRRPVVCESLQKSPSLSAKTPKNVPNPSDRKVLPEKEPVSNEVKRQDQHLKKEHGLHRFHIIPDGNCLYRAIAQALVFDQSKHMVIRKEVLQHIESNLKDYVTMIEGDPKNFLKEAAKENSWGSYTEILALTRLFDINVVIVTGGSDQRSQVNVTCHHFDPSNEEIIPRDTIWLSWLTSGHYDVILNKPYPNPHYDKWLKTVDSRMKQDQELAERLAREDLPAESAVSEVNGRRPECKKTDCSFSSGSCVDPCPQRPDNTWSLENDEQIARSLQEEEDFAALDDEYV